MRINRGLLFWGLALVTAGAVALGVQQGYMNEELLSSAWRLWPLVLVALGLSIILARTAFSVIGTVLAALVVGVAGGALLTVGPIGVGCGAGAEPATSDLTPNSGTFTASTVEVDLDFNCGSLSLGMGSGTEWSASVGRSRGPQPDVTGEAGSLTIHSEGGSFIEGSRQRWDVTLGSEPTYDISADINAADSTLDLSEGTFGSINLDPNAGDVLIDLSGAEVQNLEVNLNAGSLSISVDESTTANGSLSVNAGDLNLCTTPDTATRLSVGSNVAFGHNLTASDLMQSGTTWTSEGFETADRRVDLTVEGNAGSFTLNPEEGCA
jgi:Domain of unknown function (DUF5668)